MCGEGQTMIATWLPAKTLHAPSIHHRPSNHENLQFASVSVSVSVSALASASMNKLLG